MKKVLSLILVPVLPVLPVLPGTTVFAADRLCISQVSVEAGADAAEKLEKNGYTVPCNDDDAVRRKNSRIQGGFVLSSLG